MLHIDRNISFILDKRETQVSRISKISFMHIKDITTYLHITGSIMYNVYNS